MIIYITERRKKIKKICASEFFMKKNIKRIIHIVHRRIYNLIAKIIFDIVKCNNENHMSDNKKKDVIKFHNEK